MSCLDDPTFARLIDGALSDDERAAAEVHLDGCRACAELLRELAGVVAPLDARAWLAAAPRTTAAIDAAWREVAVDVCARHAIAEVVQPSPGRVRFDGEHPRLEPGASVERGYDAPEVIAGGPPSPRADQFTLCMAWWEAAAGEPPFRGATPGALVVAMQAPLARPAGRRFAVLARGLAFDPERRWPDVPALLAALSRPRRPVGWYLGATVLLVIVLLAWIARDSLW